jgi:hypothetical protein
MRCSSSEWVRGSGVERQWIRYAGCGRKARLRKNVLSNWGQMYPSVTRLGMQHARIALNPADTVYSALNGLMGPLEVLVDVATPHGEERSLRALQLCLHMSAGNWPVEATISPRPSRH